MWKLFSIILYLAGLTAAENVQCSQEFALQHGLVFAIPGSCDKYLACAHGILAEFTCPAGAIFDVNSHQCSSDPQAKCSEENWVVADGLCNNLDETSAVRDPHRCTRFVLCLGEFTIARQCDQGLLFNSRIGMCDTAQNVVCDVTCPVEGDELTYLPDSTGQNCARYYICENGIPQPAECSSMNYFDLVTESCTHPAVASCRIQGVTCSEQDESIANPESCTSYYRCEDGFPHFMECDADHYFFEGQCIPGDCDDLVTDETEGTTEVGTTSDPVTQSTIGTPTESPSTITTGLPPVTPEITTQTTIGTPTPSTITTEPLTTPESSTIATSTDSPSTISTELPSTTPEFTTELSTATQSTISTPTESPPTIITEPPNTTPEVTTQTTIGTPTNTPSTITTELPSTTPEFTTELSTETQSTIATPTDSPSTITTALPPTTPEMTTEPSSSTPTVEPPSTTPENTTPTSAPSTITTDLPTTPSTITTASTQTVEPSTVTGEATTTTTDTPSTDAAVVCQGVNIGVFAHPFNCYQYFVCIFDAGRLFTCGSGQIFDPLLVCVTGDRETCIRS